MSHPDRQYARKGRLRPHLVQINGHYGAPFLGVRASAERDQRQPDGTTSRVVEVVTARHSPAAPPSRFTVETRFVKPAHLYVYPQGVLENLTKCGALTLREYQALLVERLMMIQHAESLERVCRPSRRQQKEWHNVGRGVASGETREFVR